MSSKTDAEFADLLIKMKQTNATSLPNGAWSSFIVADTVLYSSRYTFPIVLANEWLEIPLQRPFDYDGTSNIAIEISGSNYRNGFATSFHNPALSNQPIRMKYGPPNGTNYTNNFPPIFLGIDVCTRNNSILGNDTVICNGSYIELHVGQFGTEYLWSDNSTQEQLTINKEGTYYVTVRDGICVNTDTIQISIAPLAKADQLLATHLDAKNFQFEVVNPENVQDFLWDFGDGTSGTVAIVTHTYSSLQNFEVTCHLTNDCGATTLIATMNQLLHINTSNANLIGLQVFPISAQNKVTIRVNELHHNYKVELLNVVGKVIEEGVSLQSINLSPFAKGAYFLKVTSLTHNISSTKKIIKN